MDRRYKDYFIVTFKWRHDVYSIGSGYMTDSFCFFPRPIKVHWKSVYGVPYALVSINRDSLETDLKMIKNRFGVDKVIPFTEQKERDLAMWNKILRLPENDVGIKYKIQKCMQQDLFINWEV
jgi:hypothetical protein